MDVIAATQEAHDEFVRAVQKVAGYDAKGLGEPLEVFHGAARAVDAYIENELKPAVAGLESERGTLIAEIDGLNAKADAVANRLSALNAEATALTEAVAELRAEQIELEQKE